MRIWRLVKRVDEPQRTPGKPVGEAHLVVGLEPFHFAHSDHGGAGTLAAGLRGGVRQLIVWTLPDQPLWGAAVKRLKVGSGRRFSTNTEKSPVVDLRRILAPQYVAQVREIAAPMTKPAKSVAAAADLVEGFARLRSVG